MKKSQRRALHVGSVAASVGALISASTAAHGQIVSPVQASSATTGVIVVNGDRAVGVTSLVWNGDNYTNGGHTTVSGVFSRGIYTLAMNGDNVTNTGTVIVTGNWARGVMAVTSAGESCGTNTVNVNGDVTASFHGIVAFGCGASAVNVSAGATVTNTGLEGIPVINISGGHATIYVDGNVIARASDAISLDPRSQSSTTVIGTTGFVFGGFDGTDGTDNFEVRSGGVWTTSGANTFGGGNDELTNAGTLNVAGATSFTGLETFNQLGRINLNANSLTLSGTALVNMGTIDTTGSASILGVTAFNNAGTLDLAPGTFSVPAVVFTNSGVILADEGASAITGQTGFTNSGMLDLQDGVTGDVLTINSAFSGSGGSNLAIDAIGNSADRLVINGTASGTTVVNVSSNGAFVFSQAGILVVDTGTTSAGAFVLGANPGNGLVNYSLVQVGQDFFLVSDPSALAFAPLAAGNLAQDMWYQGTDAYLGYAALKRGDNADRKTPVGLWAQLYASRDRYGDKETATINGINFDFDNRLRTNRRGAQVGTDFGVSGLTLGVTGGYQHAESDGDVAGFDAEGYNLGVYGLFGGPTGLYGGLLLKKDWDEVRIQNAAFESRRPDAKSTGIDGEVGYRFGSTAMLFDVQAGLSHVRTKLDDFAASGLVYDYDRISSTRGRLGGRVGFGNMFGAYVDAKLLHEFSGDTDFRLGDSLNNFDLATRGRGTWGRIEVGAGGNKVPGPQLAGWVEFGDVQGVGIRAGFRF